MVVKEEDFNDAVRAEHPDEIIVVEMQDGTLNVYHPGAVRPFVRPAERGQFDKPSESKP